jgi:50S ribosomal subunit-associated GTPase HflX
VLDTLEDMGCSQPALLIVNKCDRLTASELRRVRLSLGDIAGTSAITISARTGDGLRELRQAFDGLAGHMVADTKANRPLIAAFNAESAAHERAAG